jgi:hypothetical protein
MFGSTSDRQSGATHEGSLMIEHEVQATKSVRVVRHEVVAVAVAVAVSVAVTVVVKEKVKRGWG